MAEKKVTPKDPQEAGAAKRDEVPAVAQRKSSSHKVMRMAGRKSSGHRVF